jgi:hypothetical protein
MVLEASINVSATFTGISACASISLVQMPGINFPKKYVAL